MRSMSGRDTRCRNLILEIWEERQATILFVTHDISEAIYLSDRIYMFSASPGSIVEEVDVDFGRERTRDIKHGVRFQRYEAMILEKLHGPLR